MPHPADDPDQLLADLLGRRPDLDVPRLRFHVRSLRLALALDRAARQLESDDAEHLARIARRTARGVVEAAAALGIAPSDWYVVADASERARRPSRRKAAEDVAPDA